MTPEWEIEFRKTLNALENIAFVMQGFVEHWDEDETGDHIATKAFLDGTSKAMQKYAKDGRRFIKDTKDNPWLTRGAHD